MLLRVLSHDVKNGRVALFVTDTGMIVELRYDLGGQLDRVDVCDPTSLEVEEVELAPNVVAGIQRAEKTRKSYRWTEEFVEGSETELEWQLHE